MYSIRNQNWVCLAADDYWNSNPHSRYHIAKEFSKNGKILWVNSIGHRMPSLKKKNGFVLILRKLKSYIIFFRKPESNFYVLSPITIPSFGNSVVIKKINTQLLWFQIQLTKLLLQLGDTGYFISSPSFGILDKKLKNSLVIYYYSDLYTSYRELKNTNGLAKLDERVYNISKYVFAASDKICSTLNEQKRKATYLPHGVDVNHFKYPGAKPQAMQNIDSPIIGYYGTLSDSNDWELIEYISEKRPEYNFVFIGKKFIELPNLEKKKNVHFISKVSYKEIPGYGNCFDVAIMFWILREWIQHSSPLKLLEYFALGKPVVSVDIPEVRNSYSNLVLIGRNKEEFLERIDEALSMNRNELKEKYKKVLAASSWQNRVNTIYNYVESANV